MTLDSGFAALLGMLRDTGAPGSFDGEPGEMRARMAQAAESGWDPAAFAPVASAEDVAVGPHLRLKVFKPVADGSVPTVLYFHPGGFVMGSAHLMQDVARRLSHELPAVVVSVDYRLAPEAPFPAAVEDASAALAWVRDNIGDLGGDAGRIGLAGESSGANLAAVAALLAAREGNPVRALLLASPVTDFTASYPSVAENGTGYFLQAGDLDVIRRLYFGGDEETAKDERVSPALAGDLGALPPAVVGVAGFDPLRDDGVVFAGRLLRAGVPVALRVYADLIHPFFGMPAVSPGADRAVAELTALFAAELG
ncbi:alpha/beta hydrolase [Spongiactinospora sp. 9N601]|uniref:alpha/beta hydrolase n=1 Tax=Spongiactinospora sp. 9N601 TaxID=3375149 RepID=UPI00378BB878